MSTNEETEGGGDCKVPQEYDPADCPSPDFEEPLSTEDTAKITRELNIVPCSEGSIRGQIGPGGMGGKFGGSFSVGCAQLTAIMKKYRALSKQIECIVSKTTICEKVNISGQNNITIINGKTGEILCPMDIDQEISIKIVQTSDMSDEQNVEITQKTGDFVESFLTELQKSQTGDNANPQGQKFLDASTTEIQSSQFMSNLTDSVKSSFTEVFAGNNVTIINHGIWTCPEGEAKITINQNIAIDAVVNKVFTNALNLASEQDTIKEFLDTLEIVQDSEQNGGGGGGGGDGISFWWWIAIGIWFLGVVIIAYNYYKTPKTMAMVIAAFSVMYGGILVGLYFLFKEAGKSLNPVNWF